MFALADAVPEIAVVVKASFCAGLAVTEKKTPEVG